MRQNHLRTTTTTAIAAAALLAVGVATSAAAPATAATPTSTAAPTPTGSTTPVATPTATPTSSTPAPIPTPAPTPTPTPLPTATPTPIPTPTPTPVVGMPWATSTSRHSGHASNGRTVWMHGTGFSNLATVLVGGVVATNLVIVSDTTIHFYIAAAPTYQKGVARISFVAASDGRARASAFTFTYKIVNDLDRQMQYAFKHWNSTSSARYGYFDYNDCANFTSQMLQARGWKESADWYNDGPMVSGPAGASTPPDASLSWASSTGMSDWLKSRPDLATHLRYSQRDLAVVGDVIQFNWGYNKKTNSGWDHTAVISKVVVLPNGHHDLYYVAHTNNSTYGGSTDWFAANFGKGLRMQIWHLNE